MGSTLDVFSSLLFFSLHFRTSFHACTSTGRHPPTSFLAGIKLRDWLGLRQNPNSIISLSLNLKALLYTLAFSSIPFFNFIQKAWASSGVSKKAIPSSLVWIFLA